MGNSNLDAVRIPRRGRLVQTQLVLVEGVHFDLSFFNAREVGYRAVSTALSSLAAAAANPRHLQLTLAVRQDTSDIFLMELESGWSPLSKEFGFSLSLSPHVLSPNCLSIFVTAVGEPFADKPVLRPPRAGDLVCATGAIGGSLAALRCIKAYGRHELRNYSEMLQPHLYPRPRVNELKALVAAGASGWVEMVNGLASESHAFCEAFSVGLKLVESQLPVHPQAREAAAMLGTPDALTSWVLYGAEDYEFLVSIPYRSFQKASAAMKRLKTPLTVVGEVTAQRNESQANESQANESQLNEVQLLRTDGSEAVLENKQWHPLVRRRKAG